MTNRFEAVPDPEVEAAEIQQIADITVQLLGKRYPDGNVLRGVHPKSHGGLRATFIVNDELPDELRVGLFAQPGTHHAVVRYSNATGTVTPDIHDGNLSRGMAVKVMAVQGDFLPTGQRAEQDFLMINTPSFAIANVADYLRLSQILLKHDDDPTMFFAPLQVDVPGVTPEMKARIFRTFQVVQDIKSRVVANPLEISYFSAAPFCFGPDRVMHFAVVPAGGDKPQTLPADAGDNYLAEALAATMQGQAQVVFDFRVQVRGPDEEGLGIEDATTVWADTPYVDVAKIVIPAPQKNIDAPGRIASTEKLVFTPWHSLAAHKPLGGINRLRKAVYEASVKRRGAR